LIRRAVQVADMLKRAKRAISSRDLAKNLRLPRPQVRRLISILREAGCEIESIKGRGAGFRWVKGPRNLAKAVERVVQPSEGKVVRRRRETEAPKRVLQMLRRAKNRWVTGSAIAEKLGVSRQRVHQFISKLREMGYKIEGQPKLGYRLVGGRAERATSRKSSRVRRKK